MAIPWSPSTALRDNNLLLAEWREHVDTTKEISEVLGGNVNGTATDLGARLTAIETALGGIVQTGYRNLRIEPPTTGTDWQRQVRVRADAIAVESYWLTNVDVTVDLTVAGKNGLDTGVEGSSTHYALWLGWDPDAEEAALQFSTSYTRAGLTVGGTVSTFPAWRRIGSRRNGGDGHLIRASQFGDLVLYDADPTADEGTGGTRIVNNQTVTPYTATTVMNKMIPPPVRSALLLVQGTTSAHVVDGPSRLGDSTTAPLVVAPGHITGWVTLDDALECRYRGTGVTIAVRGYREVL
jgi:hypothetical protein